jgi:uncharacterized repeat protein (TIGR01451 family)
MTVEPLASTQPLPDDYLWQASINCAAIDADMSLSVVNAPAAAAGGLLTYTITVANAGPSLAAMPVLMDVTPPGTSFVSVSAPNGWTCSAPAAGATGTILCTPTDKCFEGSAIFTIVLRAATCAGSPLVNTISVTAGTSDPVAANNSVSGSTTIVGSASCDDGISCTTDSCNGATSACEHAPVPIAEASGLRFTSKTALTWDTAGSGFRYDLSRGLLSQLPVGGGAAESCIASGVATTSASDSQTPAPGAGFWYLVRAKNPCSAGSYGTTSAGSTRTTNACP